MASASIQKKGSGYYVVFRRPDGKQKWVAGGRTKAEAQKVKAEILYSLSRGEYRELTEASFPEFAEKWLQDYAETRLKASTVVDYRCSFRRHLVPYFGSCPLSAITPDVVQGYVSHKLREGHLSPKSINNTLVPLKEMFKHAVRWGYLRSNPAEYVEKPRVERREMDFLTAAEVNSLLTATPSYYRPLLQCAVMTGMRRGELFALQWDDVSWRTSSVFVRHSLYGGKLVSPKSAGSRRKIPVPQSLLAALAEHRRTCPESEMGLVFPTEVGTPLEGSNFLKNVFHPALRRAGLRSVRFHDLRHTYAALLIHQGENLKFVQSVLGHASIQTTLDRYGHLMPGVGEDAAARLEQQLSAPRSEPRAEALQGGISA